MRRAGAVLAAVVAVGVLAACEPPPGGPIAAPTLWTSDVSVAYQQNNAHDGVATASSLRTPLSLRWRVDLTAPGTSPTVSHPIIAGGRVFVTSSIYGTAVLVHAFDLATGRRLWGPVSIGDTHTRSGLAYGSGRLVVSTTDGVYHGFDPATGRIVWRTDIVGDTSTSPIVTGGLVIAPGDTETVALDPRDGAVVWRRTPGGTQSSPSVLGDRLFLTYGQGMAWSLDLRTGADAWRDVGWAGHGPTTAGNGGRTSVLRDGLLYHRYRDEDRSDVVRRPATGAVVGTFDSVFAPSFAGDVMITTRGAQDCHSSGPCTVHGIDRTTGEELWSWEGDGTTSIPPLVVNGVVYVGTYDGRLVGLDPADGHEVWSTDVGGNIWRSDEHNGHSPLTGLGTGGGYLAVPVHEDLLVYGPSGPALSTDHELARFAPTPVGFAGPAATTTVRNTGGQALAVGAVRIEGPAAADFAVTSTCAGARLAPRATCSVAVTYTPRAAGPDRATLVVDGPGPADTTVALQGSTR